MSPTQDELPPITHGRSRALQLGGRFATIAFGHALYASFNWIFDNILYVYAVYRLGLLKGGLLMASLAGLQCASTLLIYERMRIDWVGAGSLASVAGSSSSSWWRGLLRWATMKGDAVMFLVLCIFQDAFITTSYFRRGRFDRLTLRDWKIFAGAMLVSNFYWTVRSGAVAAGLGSVWNFVIDS